MIKSFKRFCFHLLYEQIGDGTKLGKLEGMRGLILTRTSLLVSFLALSAASLAVGFFLKSGIANIF